MQKWIATVLLAGVIAAPAAHAATRPDDRAGTRGPGAASVTQLSVRPDDRAGIRGAGASNTSAIRADSSSFDARDAAIGGAIILGLALGTGAMLLSLRRRGSPKPA